MNLIKEYVFNIKSVTIVPNLDFLLYEIICDIDCYGHKKYNTKIYVNESDYETIMKHGYRLV